jgi:CDP-diacylglycerol--glycerol-3-phosphate 3-phosphatidyltransferase
MSSVPNALTIIRIGLVPLFVAAFFLPGELGRWIVFVLFCMAGATDALDGMIARRLGAESPFGRMLDPIADKLIVSAALLMLAADGTLEGFHLVPALVILCREILVSGLREFLAAAAVSLPVTRIAKLKTAVQVAAIAALIASSATERMVPGVTAGALIGMWLAAGLTFYTGYAYLKAGLSHAQAGRRVESQQPDDYPASTVHRFDNQRQRHA